MKGEGFNLDKVTFFEPTLFFFGTYTLGVRDEGRGEGITRQKSPQYPPPEEKEKKTADIFRQSRPQRPKGMKVCVREIKSHQKTVWDICRATVSGTYSLSRGVSRFAGCIERDATTPGAASPPPTHTRQPYKVKMVKETRGLTVQAAGGVCVGGGEGDRPKTSSLHGTHP